MYKKLYGILAIPAIALAAAPGATAAPIDCLNHICMVSAPGTEIHYRADTSTTSSQDPELSRFTFGGVNHLFEQEFEILFRDGSGVPTTSQPFDLDGFNIFLTQAQADDVANTISLTFQGSGLQIDQVLSLYNSGASAGLGQTVTVRNTSTTPVDLSLFLYTDFDLNGIDNNDVSRYDGTTNTFIQHQGSVTATVRSLTTPDYYDTVLGSGETLILGSAFQNHLRNRGGPIGPGDARNAFEYQMLLAGGASQSFSASTTLVPEPLSLALLIFGIGALRVAGRHRMRA